MQKFYLAETETGNKMETIEAECLADACLKFGYDDYDVQPDNALIWVDGEHVYSVYPEE